MDRRLNTGAWRRLRRAIIERDGGLCRINGPHCTRYATSADHIVARADGGDCWSPVNLRAACRACNSGAGAERTNALRRQSKGDGEYVSRL